MKAWNEKWTCERTVSGGVSKDVSKTWWKFTDRVAGWWDTGENVFRVSLSRTAVGYTNMLHVCNCHSLISSNTLTISVSWLVSDRLIALENIHGHYVSQYQFRTTILQRWWGRKFSQRWTPGPNWLRPVARDFISLSFRKRVSYTGQNVPLSHRNPASTGTSRESCHVQGQNKGDSLHEKRIIHTIKQRVKDCIA